MPPSLIPTRPQGWSPRPPADLSKEKPDLRGAGPGLKAPGRPGPNPADARPAKPGERPLDEIARGVDTWDLIRALNPQASQTRCARTFSVMMVASLAVRTQGRGKAPPGVFRRGLGVRAGGLVVSLP